MLTDNARTALETLSALGWTVQAASEGRSLPATVAERYPAIPPSLRSFLEHVETCVRADEKVWFLTAADYEGDSGSSFAWDECETLESEDADAESVAEIRVFWDAHLPILLSVEGDYAYLAVCVDRAAKNYGAVVQGHAPEYRETSNRTWTTRYLADPNFAEKATFMATEIWAPSRAISFERRRGPELFCLLDRNEAADTQGFVLAIRRDKLSRVDLAADDVIFSVREFFEASDCINFDRRWGESGRFGSTVTISPLDRTGSTEVLHWAKAHKKHHVRSFRWRRWMG